MQRPRGSLLLPAGNIVRISVCNLRRRLATPGGRRFQILPHAPRAGNIPITDRFLRGHGAQLVLVMDEVAPGDVKHFGIVGYNDLQVGGNGSRRLSQLRPQGAFRGIRIRQPQTQGKQQHCRHRHQPRRPRRPGSWADTSVASQPFFQPLAEARWRLDHAFITVQTNDIPSAFKNRRTTPAAANMLVHFRAQTHAHLAVHIAGDLAPDCFATHPVWFHIFSAHHGLVPFSKGRRLNQPCSHPPASRSRNMSRARRSRVFTEATEMPSASAVSWMFNCSMSRSTKTSRYFRSSDASASASFCRTSFRSRASDGISRQSANSRGVYSDSSSRWLSMPSMTTFRSLLRRMSASFTVI